MDLKRKAKCFVLRYGQDKDNEGKEDESEIDIDSIEVIENANYAKKLKEDFNIKLHDNSPQPLNQDDVQDIDPEQELVDILSDDDELKTRPIVDKSK